MGLFSRSEPATHFPPAQGRRLDGTDVAFPDDLPADATLLVVLFRDDLDPLADQWARLGARLADAHGERVAVVEAPVVNKKLKFLGGLATTGIRGQVETDAERERTVPLYVDVKAFRKALGLKDTGDVYAFLVARDGRIAWRGEGDIDLDEVGALEAAVLGVLDAAEGADDAGPDEPEAGPAADGAPPADEPEPGDGPTSGPDEDATPTVPNDAPGEGPHAAELRDGPPPVGGA
jgi:hypothetical protein